MKKTVSVLVSVLALWIGACIPIPGLTPTPVTGPTINPDDQLQTAIAQTLTARPTFPPGSVTDTATVASPVVPATDTATPVLSVTDTLVSQTPTIDLSATAVTATSIPGSGTVTATLAPGQVTPIWTLAIRTYGTLPPAVPFSHITLVNKAKAEAYISLQVTMPDDKHSILEYPVEGRIKIEAPVGWYLYVAWVGGRKMVGEFRLHHSDDLTVTLYKDRIVVH